MRIGLVCPYNYFRPGGVQSIIRELAIELENRGHYVRIIAPKSRVLPETIPDNIILIGGSAELNTFATKSDIGLSISNEKLDAMLKDQDFDVLHFHEPGIPILGVQLLSRSRTASVATMHAVLPDGMVTKSFQKIMKPVARYLNTNMHSLTAVSKIAEETAHIYVPSADITIVPNGIRLKDFAPKKVTKPNKKQKTIAYVGRLEKRKGVKYLLMAYNLLRKEHDDVKLVIAGNGDLLPSLKALIKKNSIPDVTFKGWITDAEKVDLLQSADLYCSPALYGESFGIVLLEAMAAGTVIVAGNNPGYASVMEGRGRLSLVSPIQTVDFAQRLELMLYDQEIRDLWSKWAGEYIKQFDYSNVVDQYESIYKKAIDKFKAEKK